MDTRPLSRNSYKDRARPSLRRYARANARRREIIANGNTVGSSFEARTFKEHVSIEMWGKLLVSLSIIAWSISLFTRFSVGVTILTVAGLVLVIVGLRKTGLGLLGIGILSTIDPLTRGFLTTGGLLRWNTVNYLLLFICLYFINDVLRLRDPHSRILQAFALLLGLELFISPSILAGIQDILNIVAFFGLVIIFIRAGASEANYYWLGVVCASIGAVGGAVYFLQYETMPYLNPNAWSLFPLAALFGVCIGFPSARMRNRSRLTYLILGGINLAWIFLSGSRGSILVGVICLIYILMMMRSPSWILVVLVFLAILSIGLSIGFAEEQSYTLGRIQKLFDTNYTLSERTSGRSIIAESGWYLFLQNPLGLGTGSFRYEASKIDILNERQIAAHSAWVKTLAENGILGVVLIAAFVLSFAFTGLKKRNADMLLVGALVSLSFGVGFLSKEFQGKAFWFLAAGAVVLLHQAEIQRWFREEANSRLDHYRRRTKTETFN